MTHARIIVVGAGGFGREVVQYLRDIRSDGVYDGLGHDVAGVLDDAPDPGRIGAIGVPYLGPIDAYAPEATDRFVLAIGEPKIRLAIAQRLAERGARFLTLVHPRAYVASSARIGEGSIVAPFASVGAGAELGRQVQVHFYASAAHDTHLGDGVALSPYSVANGGAWLGEGAFLGTRATVNPLRWIGAWARITAGSVVYRDVPAHAVVSGNPAKTRVLGISATTGVERHAAAVRSAGEGAGPPRR